jgi:hypothetical protein
VQDGRQSASLSRWRCGRFGFRHALCRR